MSYCQIFQLLVTLWCCANGLASDITHTIPLVPLTSTDTGTGIYSQNYNSPYQAIRHSAGLNNIVTRVSFHTYPQIPVGSTVSSWSFGLKSSIYDFPSWLTFIAPWSGSHDFAMEFNATDALRTGQTPPSFTFELRGSVYYTHGPTRFVEQEQRVVRIMCHLHLATSLNQRTEYIAPYFSQGSVLSGQTPLSLRPNVQKVKLDELGYHEQYNFNCPGGISDSVNGCTLESTATGGVMWANDESFLVLNTGVLRIKSPLATWGAIIVKADAVLVIDQDDSTKSVAIFGSEGIPLLLNHGTVIVQKGVLRLVGTTATGNGIMRVGREGALELDPRATSGFLTSEKGKYDQVLISEGVTRMVSGEIHLNGGLVIQGEGVLHVGMACLLTLEGTVTHILGGGMDGSAAVQEYASIISGGLVQNTETIFHGGARVQGLGYISMQAAVTVDISFAGAAYPEAGIATFGPPSERIHPGITIAKSLRLMQGGQRLSTGIYLPYEAELLISQHGFLHFYDEGARNELYGSITNDGSIVGFTPSTLQIDGKLLSTSMIRLIHSQSHLIAQSKSQIILSRQHGTPTGTSASTPTHQFAQFVGGSLVLRDNAIVHMHTEKSQDYGLEKPRYYAGSVFNSGDLQLYEEGVLETCVFEQRADSQEATHYYPRTSLQNSGAGLHMVHDGKYTYHADTGLILESLPPAKQALRAVKVKFGALGGVDGSRISGSVHLEKLGTWNPGTSFPTARIATDGSAFTAGDYALHGATQRAYAQTVEDATLRVDQVFTGSAVYYDQFLLDSEVQLIRSRIHIVTNMHTNIHVVNTLESGTHRMSTMQSGAVAFKLPVLQATRISGQFLQVSGVNSRNPSMVKIDKGTKAPFAQSKSMKTMATVSTNQASNAITQIVEYNTEQTTVSITGYVTGRSYGWDSNSAFSSSVNFMHIGFSLILALLGYMYIQFHPVHAI